MTQFDDKQQTVDSLCNSALSSATKFNVLNDGSIESFDKLIKEVNDYWDLSHSLLGEYCFSYDVKYFPDRFRIISLVADNSKVYYWNEVARQFVLSLSV